MRGTSQISENNTSFAVLAPSLPSVVGGWLVMLHSSALPTCCLLYYIGVPFTGGRCISCFTDVGLGYLVWFGRGHVNCLGHCDISRYDMGGGSGCVFMVELIHLHSHFLP